MIINNPGKFEIISKLLRYLVEKMSLIPRKKYLKVIKEKDNIRYLLKNALVFAFINNKIVVTKPMLLVNKKIILYIIEE